MTAHKDDGGPIYPVKSTGQPGVNYVAQGMTLRDHFAGLAMQAIRASNSACTPMIIADAAWKLADAMIKARSA